MVHGNDTLAVWGEVFDGINMPCAEFVDPKEVRRYIGAECPGLATDSVDWDAVASMVRGVFDLWPEEQEYKVYATETVVRRVFFKVYARNENEALRLLEELEFEEVTTVSEYVEGTVIEGVEEIKKGGE
jgi:hypothetical protein